MRQYSPNPSVLFSVTALNGFISILYKQCVTKSTSYLLTLITKSQMILRNIYIGRELVPRLKFRTDKQHIDTSYINIILQNLLLKFETFLKGLNKKLGEHVFNKMKKIGLCVRNLSNGLLVIFAILETQP